VIRFPAPSFFWRLIRRSGRAFGTVVFGLIVLLAITVGVLRAFVLPNVDRFRPQFAAMASDVVGRPVSLGPISGGWSGVRPWVTVSDVVVHDPQGRPAFRLERIEARVGWSSLVALDLRCRALILEKPEVVVRRDRSGQISVGGIPIAADAGPSRFPDWLFSQHRVVVTGAKVTWVDETRSAPPLQLDQVEFDLRNRGRVHRFLLSAKPDFDVGTAVEVRGEFRGGRRQDLRNWSGRAYLRAPYLNLGAARQWLDLPTPIESGAGQVEGWVEVGGRTVQAATFDVRLAGVTTRLDDTMPPLDVPTLEGRFTWLKTLDGFEAAARSVSMGVAGGGRLPAADVIVRRSEAKGNLPAKLQVESDHLDLGPMLHVLAYLPMDPRLRRAIADHRPAGRLRELSFALQTPAAGPSTYSFSSRFEGVGVDASGRIPGVRNLTGSVTADQNGGEVHLDATRVSVRAPLVLDDTLALDRLTAVLGWKLEPDAIVVDFRNVSAGNADVAARANGTVRQDGAGTTVMDLVATIDRASATSVWRYLPKEVGADTRAWLRGAIRGGNASQGKVVLKGDLARFPFDDGSGAFEISAEVADGTLVYAPEWPAIERIQGTLRFTGKRMAIDARGEVLGARLAGVQVGIADLSADDTIVTVKGQATGPVSTFLRFLDDSPVGAMVGNVGAGVRATGDGALGLQLQLPLHRLDDTKVAGTFLFQGNRVEGLVGLPPVDRLRGTLEFSEKGARVQKGQAEFLGGAARFDLATQAGGVVKVEASGTSPVAVLRQHAVHPVLGRLSGAIDWNSVTTVRPGRFEITVDSNLVGLAVDLPAPLGKATADVVPTRFQLQTRKNGHWLSAVVADRASVVAILDDADGGWVLRRGAVEFGGPARMPEQNALTARGTLARLDLDEWQAVLPKLGPDAPTASNSPIAALPVTLDLRFGTVEAYGREFNDVALSGQRRSENWRLAVAAKAIEGALEWYPRGRGRFVGKLARLYVPDPVPGPQPGGDLVDGGDLPEVDVQIDHFTVGPLNLGQLVLQAAPEGATWALRKLDVRNPDGHFTAQGGWQLDQGKPRTQMAIRIEAQDIGRMLARLNRPEGVSGGTARLAGMVEWQGSPLRVDTASLSGRLSLEARGGRFTQLEPGIGKLFGILSLQALPRRVALDFRDVFSDGFAFDDIVANSVIDRGVMRTDDFRMVGSSAKVSMKGTVDVVHESQNLIVRVIPSITDSIAVGTAIVNPLAGLIALIVGKALDNPLDRVIAFEYQVTGPWTDPVVAKVQKAPIIPERSGRR